MAKKAEKKSPDVAEYTESRPDFGSVLAGKNRIESNPG